MRTKAPVPTLFAWVTLFALLSAVPVYASVIYVRPSGNDANDGLSWALAKKTVQAAVNAANQGDEIWVAAGTYPEHIKNKTTGPSGSEVAVDTALYGGFAGTETERTQRNWQTNLTILDGGGAAAPTVNGSVIIIDSLATQATRIDGFVITGGHGIAAGGIFISVAGPVITNNTIKRNSSNVGGGILIYNFKITEPKVHPVITNNAIYNNYAIEAGGGIVVVGSERLGNLYGPVAPLISRNSIFWNVSAFHGGGIGIYGHAAPQITNNYIFSNTAAYDEANYMGNGGGIYATSRDVDDTPLEYAVCAPVIVGNVIAANGANYGGGIQLWDTDVEHGGIPVVTNNSVFGNSGTGISWVTTKPIIQNNLIAYNSRGLEQGDSESAAQALRNNCVYGNELWEEKTDYNGLADQTGINGNISADPKMANYKIGNFRLQTGSPCVDAGYSAAIGEGWTDLDGQARIIGSAVDIGADELQGTVGAASTPIYYVRTSGNDSQNGLSWATAKKTVWAAIAAAEATGGEIWVAAGTYVERNLLPAFIYLYGGFAGTETDRASRNVSANQTILDGGGGQPTVVNSLYAGYFLSAIDGFTIQHGGLYTGGGNPGNGGYGGRGAGIYCQVTSPLIQNNTIRHNSLSNPFDDPNRTGYGAGIYTYLSYALIQDNLITENEILSDNSDTGSGGGIYFFRSMPTILRNTISNNRAISGAAIYGSNAYPRIIENVIENNSFYDDPVQMPGYYMGANEGAITLAMCWNALIERNRIKGNIAATGAGIHVSTQFAGRIQNNLILDNSADGMGGGIYAEVPVEATSSLYIVNNTIAGNTSVIGWGGGIAVSIPPAIVTPPEPIPHRIVIANNIIAFNSSGIFETLTSPMVPPTMVKNDVYNTGSNYIYISAGATDIHVDPQFVDKPGGDFHLKSGSPCIDTGEDSVNGLPQRDLEGEERVQDGNRDGTPVVDMGAFEYPGPAFDEVAVDFGASGLFHYANGVLSKLSPNNAEGMCPLGKDLYADFGATGFWKYSGTAWTKLSSSNAQAMLASGTDMVVDFGSVGLWKYSGSWLKLSPSDAEDMIASGSDLYVDFGGIGLYRYNGSWTKVSPSNAEAMLAVGTDLYVDLGTVGFWKYNGSAWSRLSTSNAEGMTAVGTDVYVDFGVIGLWKYSGSWSKASPSNAEGMLAVGTDLCVDFGTVGFWKYNGTTWNKLSASNAEAMTAVGADVYVDFGGIGLWKYSVSWSKASPSNAEAMLAVGTDLYVDFGTVGFWKYDGATWSKLSGSNAESMCAVNLE
jgi:hypothetical protein